MKKSKKILVIIIVCIFIFLSLDFWWEALFSDIIPWTRTRFINYQEFDDLLYDENCFGGNFFMEEIPKGSENVKYYWHRRIMEKYAAYSVKLTDAEYEQIAENRLNAYYEELEDSLDSIVYVLQDDDYLYVEDSGWYDEESLGFISDLMQNAGMDKQYYFLIVNKYNTSCGICYNGVILNDATQELIEFSAEMRDDVTPYVRRLFWSFEEFYKETKNTLYQKELPESAHNMAYYVCEDVEDYKSAYRATFVESDYNLLKQECLDFYGTRLTLGEKYVFTKNSKRYLDLQNIETYRIDFLDEFLTEDEAGQYYFLCERFLENDGDYSYCGVLCNDETYEIIEYSYYGPMEYRYQR